jgi:hypothetical protein
METMLYWLVTWPWFVAIVVVLGLAQLPLGPWYVSAWFMIGVALLVVKLRQSGEIQAGSSDDLYVPTERSQSDQWATQRQRFISEASKKELVLCGSP